MQHQGYWNKCACNEYDALLRRHACGDIQPRGPLWPRLRHNLLLIAETLKHEISFERQGHVSVMEHTRPSIKKRYKNAWHNMKSLRMDVGSAQARLTSFVKFEKIPLGKIDVGKPPRLIQFRSYEYLYCLKSYILTHSMLLKTTKTSVFNNQEMNTVFTKLYDTPGIARVLRESWDSFKNPVAVCLDHSKFDGHYVTDLLNLEHEYWNKLFASPFLKRLLDMQLHNKGVTQNGLRYKLTGHRASGEYTTSEGNTLMNYAMIHTVCEHLGIDVRIHVNGDDSVIVAESQYKDKIVNAVDLFRQFNMETGVEKVAEHFQEIVYCQSSPVRKMVKGRMAWYMIKEPIRTMSRMCYCDSKFGSALLRFVGGMALCELAVSSGIPILQAFTLALLSRSMSVRPLGAVDKFPARLASSDAISIYPVEEVTREDFSIAFGYTPNQQISMENELAGLLRSPQDLNKFIERYKNFHLQ